jgi:hypothetical protein
VTLVYKAGGAPDPNGSGYNGSGNTGTLMANGKKTSDPQPGDLVFYRSLSTSASTSAREGDRDGRQPRPERGACRLPLRLPRLLEVRSRERAVSLDQQVSELTARVRRLEKREPPLAGTFIDSATTPADDLRVIAPDWDDGEHAFGPVRWHPIGGALPQVGDECMIVERSDGVWAVAGWWSDSQGTGIAQSTIDALDARLDALEGASKVAFPYASGWADRGAGFESASYSLHGTIFEVSTGATDARGRIHVESSGNVTWQAGSTTETDNASLSGIQFEID